MTGACMVTLECFLDFIVSVVGGVVVSNECFVKIYVKFAANKIK